jgi:NTE family protein
MAHHSEIIPLMPEFEDRVSTFSVEALPQIMDEGERIAEMYLPYLQRLLT